MGSEWFALLLHSITLRFGSNRPEEGSAAPALADFFFDFEATFPCRPRRVTVRFQRTAFDLAENSAFCPSKHAVQRKFPTGWTCAPEKEKDSSPSDEALLVLRGYRPPMQVKSAGVDTLCTMLLTTIK